MSETTKKIGVFDFVASINQHKNIFEEHDKTEILKEYSPWLVNKAFSYFSDTIFYANELNKYPQLDAEYQYSFLLNTIRARKRFSKWYKKGNDDKISMISTVFNCSPKKAESIISLLSEEQLMEIIKKTEKGGLKNGKSS